MKLVTIIAMLLLSLAGAAGSASGAEPKPDKPGRDKPGRGKPKVIELEAMVIEGKVAKPQVFYVLGRSRVQYENLKLQRVFVDRILEGAKKNPF